MRQDYAEAAKWYHKAAGWGFAEAQTNLGIMYYTDLGVPKDNIQALMWLHLATSGYPASEKAKWEKAGKIRDISASKMTPAQIAKVQRLAREWKPKTALNL